MNPLAIFGGSPVRDKLFPAWPVFGKREEEALLGVLRSGKWWRYAYSEAPGEAGLPQSKVAEFERAFARPQGAKYGIACAISRIYECRKEFARNSALLSR
jgi:hypothetical protein